MQLMQAYKFEIEPNGSQRQMMSRFAGSCRFVYNKALALQKDRHERGEKRLRVFDTINLLPQWKIEFPWLKDCHSQALQQSLKSLESAYVNFFSKRTEFPKFKKKGNRTSFRYPQGYKVDQSNSRMFLPKIGWVKYRNSRVISGDVKNITVSESVGRWYASIQTLRTIDTPVHPSSSSVGVDVGIVRFATLSDGEVIDTVSAFREQSDNLRKAQRSMSRKKKFSQNWKKAKRKVQLTHSRIASTRKDFLHKISTSISKNHAIVCIEDLKVKNMSKSSAGTIKQPGKMVKQKSGLNKSILDQGWGEFRRQLEYKTQWLGGQLVAVCPRNTSRTCPCCESVSKENRKTQSAFKCIECGYEENADLVGAINILRAGLARIACEVNGAVKPSAAGTLRIDSSVLCCA